MSISLEKQKLSFKKENKKETEVEIISETFIGKGAFGEVFDTVIKIGGKKRRLIRKRYFDTLFANDRPSAIENIKSAVKHYSMAKNAGLKVFPTFRINEDQKSILMTTGFSDDKICISRKEGNEFMSVTEFGKPLIKEIRNLDEFISKLFAEGLKAIKNGISIFHDVPFIILSKEEPTTIDFVLGDLDNLLEKEKTKTEGKVNIMQLKFLLTLFNEKNVDPSFREEFLRKVKYHYEKYIANINEDRELK